MSPPRRPSRRTARRAAGRCRRRERRRRSLRDRCAAGVSARFVEAAALGSVDAALPGSGAGAAVTRGRGAAAPPMAPPRPPGAPSRVRAGTGRAVRRPSPRASAERKHRPVVVIVGELHLELLALRETRGRASPRRRRRLHRPSRTCAPGSAWLCGSLRARRARLAATAAAVERARWLVRDVNDHGGRVPSATGSAAGHRRGPRASRALSAGGTRGRPLRRRRRGPGPSALKALRTAEALRYRYPPASSAASRSSSASSVSSPCGRAIRVSETSSESRGSLDHRISEPSSPSRSSMRPSRAVPNSLACTSRRGRSVSERSSTRDASSTESRQCTGLVRVR